MKLYFYNFSRLYISIIIEQLSNIVQVFVRKKRKTRRVTVNLNIWVKSNELRKYHGRKCWFCSIIIYPFYVDILIKIWNIWKKILLWNLKFLPKCLFVKNSGITFQLWKSSLNNLFTQEHCIIVILFLKSTLFIPPFS